MAGRQLTRSETYRPWLLLGVVSLKLTTCVMMLVLFSSESQNCNHDAAAGGTQEPAERVDR